MSEKRLTADQKNFYAENGYILVKNVFPASEAAAFRAAGHALIDRLKQFREVDSTWDAVKGKGTQIYHCHDVQFHSAIFGQMLLDTRLTSLMQDVIGPNVQLHHCKMFIKPPEKGSPFPMHQDHPYFPHERHTMSAAIIHFDDAPIEKGCLRVVPGSHKLGPLTPDNPRDNSLSMEKYPIESAHPCEAQAGDVLIFNYLTIHGSGINVSKEARTTVLVQFRDPLDKPLVKTHESRGQGTMLAGIDPSCSNLPAWEKAEDKKAKGAVAV